VAIYGFRELAAMEKDGLGGRRTSIFHDAGERGGRQASEFGKASLRREGEANVSPEQCSRKGRGAMKLTRAKPGKHWGLRSAAELPARKKDTKESFRFERLRKRRFCSRGERIRAPSNRFVIGGDSRNRDTSFNQI